MFRQLVFAGALGAMCFTLTQCASDGFGGGTLGGPTVSERNAQISAEPQGDYFVGRRYFVRKTRFWGYLRKPGQSWNRAQLVIFNEGSKLNPDRMPENGPPGQRYSFDNNFEYKIQGNYTGRTVYEPNSNQFLKEFRLTGYEVLNRQPGWLFSPKDRYDPYRITMTPR